MIRNRILAVVLGSGLAIAGFAVAQKRPAQNVSSAGHPNLAAAQKLSQQAWDKLVAAQKANEFDQHGHAAKAKALLEQVNNELSLATEASGATNK